MELEDFERLLTAEGQSALRFAAELSPSEDRSLKVVETLRRKHDAHLARLAVSMTLLRRAARKKFAQAEKMYFTRDALEQASGDIVAEYRAERYRTFDEIGDYCCGIGGDTIAFAHVARVQAVDMNPLRLRMAEANVRALNLEERVAFKQGDFGAMLLPPVKAAFIDPDRRALGRRRIRLGEYSPTWSVVTERLSSCHAWSVKVAPAVPWDELEPLDAEVEFVSVHGELKECILWFGQLRSSRRRATVLPRRVSLVAECPGVSKVGSVRDYLHDPDPAVTRAGLVANLGELLGAHQIDSSGAFLSSDQPSSTPLARSYRVEAVLPFHFGKLRSYLRQRQVGHVTWVKRGSAVDVEPLSRQLKLSGTEQRAVLLTRIANRPSVVVGSSVGQHAASEF